MWWHTFLQDWNGTSFIPQKAPSRVITSDASGSFGCGAFSTQHGWFQLQWPESWSDIGITQKELVPIVVAATVWGPAWTNTCVRFRSDNMAVVEILRSRTSRDPLAMHLLRCLAHITNSTFAQNTFQACKMQQQTQSPGITSLFFSP